MKRIEITLQVETEEFVIESIEPISKKNMLLMNLEKERRKNEWETEGK